MVSSDSGKMRDTDMIFSVAIGKSSGQWEKIVYNEETAGRALWLARKEHPDAEFVALIDIQPKKEGQQ
jgi:hypothetical protein